MDHQMGSPSKPQHKTSGRLWKGRRREPSSQRVLPGIEHQFESPPVAGGSRLWKGDNVTQRLGPGAHKKSPKEILQLDQGNVWGGGNLKASQAADGKEKKAKHEQLHEGAREYKKERERCERREHQNPETFKCSVGVLSRYKSDATEETENAFLQEELGGLKYRDIPIETFLQTILDIDVSGDDFSRMQHIASSDDIASKLQDLRTVGLDSEPTDVEFRCTFRTLVQSILKAVPFIPTFTRQIPEIGYIDTSNSPLLGASSQTARRPDGVLFHREQGWSVNVVPKWTHVLVPFQFRTVAPKESDETDPSKSTPIAEKPGLDTRTANEFGVLTLGKRDREDSGHPLSKGSPEFRESKRFRSDAPTSSKIRTGDVSIEGKATKLTDREQIASFAVEMMSLFGDRRHVLGIYVDGLKIEIWYFDRSGALGSAPIDLESNDGFTTFVALILGLAQASRAQLGYEPFIKPPTAPKGKERRFPVQTDGHNIWIDNHPYIITHTLFKSRGLLGRGTTVFRVEDASDRSQSYAAKLSWQPIDKPCEGETIARIKERLQREVDILQSERKGLQQKFDSDPSTTKHIDQSLHDIESIGLPDVAFSEDLACLCSVATFRGMVIGPTYRQRLQDGLPSHNRPTNPDRVLRVILMNDLYRPLFEVLDISEFKQAFISLVKSHRVVYSLGKVLHGDITIDNLMVRCDDHSKGVLIDFDLSVDFEMQPIPEPHAGFIGDRSGSMPFLAIDLLRDQATPLRYRHDLESFYWSLWWLSIYFDEGKRNGRARLTNWHHGTWRDMLLYKLGELRRGLETLAEVSNQFYGVKGWLYLLNCRFLDAHNDWTTAHRRAVFRKDNNLIGYDYETLGGHITYENFIQDIDLNSGTLSFTLSP